MYNFISPDLEQDLIRHCIKDTIIMSDCSLKIKSDIFGSDINRYIYNEILEHFIKWNKLPTELELLNKIKDTYNKEDKENLIIVIKNIYGKKTDTDFKYVLNELLNKYKSRILVNNINSISEFLKNGNVEDSEKMLCDYVNNYSKTNLFEEFDVFENVGKIIDNSRLAEENSKYATTGIACIDEVIKGLKEQEFGVFVGESGGYKTTMLLNICVYNYLCGKKVALFVIESPPMQYMLNSYSYITGINASNLHEGEITDEFKENLKNKLDSVSEISGGKFIIIDCPQGLTPELLQIKIKELKRKHGNIDLVVIDYMQIMELSGGRGLYNIYDWQNIANISKKLKAIARAEYLPIWSAAQKIKTSIKSKDSVSSDDDIAYAKTIKDNSDVLIKIQQDENDRAMNVIRFFFMKIRRKKMPYDKNFVCECDIDNMRIDKINALRVINEY